MTNKDMCPRPATMDEYKNSRLFITHCRECEYHRNGINMCDIWHAHTSPEGYCHRGKIYGKGE